MRYILLCFLCSIPLCSVAESKNFDEKSAISTAGKKSGSRFSLSISNLASSSLVKTSDKIELALSLIPDASDIGKSVDLFNVINIEGAWWMLSLEGAYVPWTSLSLKQLEPFAEQVILEDENNIELLSGNFSATGEIKLFFAYIADGATDLVVTPQAFKFTIEEGEPSVGIGTEQALSLYQSDIEEDIVQTKCIACHVTGGIARDSKLIFSRPNDLSSENNFNTFKNLLIEKNDFGKHVLNKVTGGNSHGGGAQISSGSNEYSIFSDFIETLASSLNPDFQSIRFENGEEEVTQTSNILSNIILEDTSETVRRSALVFAGRLPTTIELNQFKNGKDYAKRQIIKSFMDESYFHDFVFNAVEERLFITSTFSGGFNAELLQFPYLREAICDAERDIQPEKDWDFRRKIIDYGNRTAHELFYYVIANDLPYTEILTADYVMLNKFLNPLLLGTATFDKSDDEAVYKPANIEGYINEIWNAWEDQSELEIVNQFPCPDEIPVSDILPYPHAGILSDGAFLDRYPTTATNRNRARARWVLYHFLGIDIEKSSQRPVDPEVLADTNNPTMNNSNCAVCHAILDPVAGAFQNWNDFSYYQPVGGALDQNYKHPPDGSETDYEWGDYWYRDMRAPGLFEHAIQDNDFALQELAELIVKESGFRTAAVKFWWPAVMGSPLLDRPAAVDDYGYENQLAAYDAQQAAVKEFAEGFNQDLNLKELLIDMVLSPWFRGATSSSDDFTGIQTLSDLGAETRLSGKQLYDKTGKLGGYYWGNGFWRLNDIHNNYGAFQDYNVIFGGIDSKAVLEKQQEYTPVILSVALTHATDSACPIVLKEFILAKEDRRLFSMVEESITPDTDENLIKKQISQLYSRLHGKKYAIDDYEVAIAYELFESIWNEKKTGHLQSCHWGNDATFLDELFDELGIDDLDDLTEINTYGLNWSQAGNEVLNPYTSDPYYTKKAWVAVMIYMLSHYDYLHE